MKNKIAVAKFGGAVKDSSKRPAGKAVGIFKLHRHGRARRGHPRIISYLIAGKTWMPARAKEQGRA
jgi:hypothetical protein